MAVPFDAKAHSAARKRGGSIFRALRRMNFFSLANAFNSASETPTMPAAAIGKGEDFEWLAEDRNTFGLRRVMKAKSFIAKQKKS